MNPNQAVAFVHRSIAVLVEYRQVGMRFLHGDRLQVDIRHIQNAIRVIVTRELGDGGAVQGETRQRKIDEEGDVVTVKSRQQRSAAQVVWRRIIGERVAVGSTGIKVEGIVERVFSIQQSA